MKGSERWGARSGGGKGREREIRTEPSSTNVILACLLLITGLVNAARTAPSEFRTKPEATAAAEAVPRTKSIVRWTPRMNTYSR